MCSCPELAVLRASEQPAQASDLDAPEPQAAKETPPLAAKGMPLEPESNDFGSQSAVGILSVSAVDASLLLRETSLLASSLEQVAKPQHADVLGGLDDDALLQMTLDPDWAAQDEHRRVDAHPCPSALEVQRGPLGVMALSMSLAFLKSGEGTRQFEATFSGTICAPEAKRGKCMKWVRGEVLGYGTLGCVFSALDQESGRLFAVKEVNINEVKTQDVQFKEALEREIDILSCVRHAQIVSYLGHDYFDGNLYVYLEHMAGGSLESVLSQFGPLDESLIRVYTRELLEGLDYLHTHAPPIMHRDLKGANVLVGIDCKVKLSDFGCSKRSDAPGSGVDFAKTMIGSIPWMAPEVIAQTGYGLPADIWSFGCVMIEMATAQRPWGNLKNPIAACARISMSNETPPVPPSLSAECRDFIESCVRRCAAVRLSTQELLQHELVCDLVTDGPERRGMTEYLEMEPAYGTLKDIVE